MVLNDLQPLTLNNATFFGLAGHIIYHIFCNAS